MLFEYPKVRHARRLSPPRFRHHGTYKRYLQREFSRVCVYCRQPDSSAPNLNFGVDHYKPKDKFGNLRCVYSNLYYCCGSCNSRKSNYWPLDAKAGPHVINPCDYAMAAHIQFCADTGCMEPRTAHGAHTVDFLQLNEPASVRYRQGTIGMLRLLKTAIAEGERACARLREAAVDGLISQTDFEREQEEIARELHTHRHMLESLSGTLPLRALVRQPSAAGVLWKDAQRLY